MIIREENYILIQAEYNYPGMYLISFTTDETIPISLTIIVETLNNKGETYGERRHTFGESHFIHGNHVPVYVFNAFAGNHKNHFLILKLDVSFSNRKNKGKYDFRVCWLVLFFSI